MAACSLFEEDEVYVQKHGKGYTFGLILENSEFLSSSDEDETDKSEDRLQKGTVRVAWHPTGKETVLPEDKVHLVDRSLMPGDVVRRLIPGEDSQCGFVMDMDVRCHMHVLRTNKYIYNVNSKDLLPIQKFESGQEVMLDSWLGRVENVTVEVILVFPSGARCSVDENDIYSFDDLSEKKERHGEFSVCPYYPGQELKGPFECLSDAKWIHSTPRYCSKVANKKGKSTSVHITIDKIVTKSVEVHWVFRGYEKADNTSEAVSPPPRIVTGDDVEKLKILDWFHHCSIQIGDRMSYRVKNDDDISTVEPGKAFDPKVVMVKDAPMKHASSQDTPTTHLMNNDAASNATPDKEEDPEEDADFEDVGDDDSDDDEKLGACGGRILGGRSGGGRKKTRGFKGGGNQRHKSGKPPANLKGAGRKRGRPVKANEVVEVEAEFTTSWAVVMWQDGTIERDIPSVELFPVHHLDELEFFPGDFVLPNIDLPQPSDYGVVVKADHAERTCLVRWFKAYDVGKASEPTLVEDNVEMSVYDIKDHQDYKFRPGQSVVRVGGFENLPADHNKTPQAVGQIYELDPNGHLVIKWADGSISQCYPQEVFIVSDESEDFSDNESWESESDYESDGSSETWETESEQEIIGEEASRKADKDDSGYDQGALCEHKQELDSLLSRAETALVRLQKLLNNFDVTVSAPECFHDIIRIYRSCHDLDKILQSSFFSDSELQSLIAQAKVELRRDKANKVSKHLTQLFESWSKNFPSGPTDDCKNIGTVAVGGKTIRVGTLKKGGVVEVSVEVPTVEDDSDETLAENSMSLEGSGATGGDGNIENRNDGVRLEESQKGNSDSWGHSQSGLRGMKKESSEPAISNYCKNHEAGERRPSDPVVEVSSVTGAKSKKKNTEANLVGENCVSKAAKRSKSDGYDDSGREAKKSKDEAKTSSHVAQELCFKICQNLQKQILKIHEEVNKRTKRLMTTAVHEKETDTPDSENSSLTGVFEVISASCENKESAADKSEEYTVEYIASLEEESCKENTDVNIASNKSGMPEKDPSIPQPYLQPEYLTAEVLDCVEQICNEADWQETVDMKEQASVGVDFDGEGFEVFPSESSPPHKDEEECATLEELKAMQIPCKGFEISGEAEAHHQFVTQESQPSNPRTFGTAVKKELKLFQTSLPDGIFVKGFENRLDLYSIMILGPEGTPYEDALFLFDIMLPNDYPTSPPQCHYHSFCSDRLNPNLYEDGKVCISLLGTWSGKGTEVWTSKSNLLQVLLSIQGLILVPEPYYNEAGYERQRGTQVGHENSRMYNEMAVLKTVQSLTRMCQNLPATFKHEIYRYLKSHGPRMIKRLTKWMEESERQRKQAVGQHGGPSKILKENSQKQQLDNLAQNSGNRSDHASFETASPSEIALKREPQCLSGSDRQLTESKMNPTENNDNETALSHFESSSKSFIQEPLVSDENAQSTLPVDLECSEAIKGVHDLHIEPTDTPDQYSSEHSLSHEKTSGTVINKDEALHPSTGLSMAKTLSDNKAYEESTIVDPGSLNTTSPLDLQAGISEISDENKSFLPINPGNNDLDKKKHPCLSLNNGQSETEHAADNGLDTNPLESQDEPFEPPDFPLFPMSRGFCLTLEKFLNFYNKALEQLEDPSSS